MSTYISDSSTLGTEWTKSSFSGGNSNCVEFSRLDHGLAVRDSKNQRGAALRLRDSAARAFVAGVKAGSFDR